MANNLFNSLNGGQINFQAQLQQLRANPVQFLMNRKLNIPQEIQGDPQQIVQHLLNTGQMSQERYAQLQNVIKNLPI